MTSSDKYFQLFAFTDFVLFMYHSSSFQSPGTLSDGLSSCILSAQQVTRRAYPRDWFFSQTIYEGIAGSSTPPFSPPLPLPRFIACTKAGCYPHTLVTHVTLIWMPARYRSTLRFSLAHLLSGKYTGKLRRELWPAGEDPLSQCFLPGVSPRKSSSRVRSRGGRPGSDRFAFSTHQWKTCCKWLSVIYRCSGSSRYAIP